MHNKHLQDTLGSRQKQYIYIWGYTVRLLKNVFHGSIFQILNTALENTEFKLSQNQRIQINITIKIRRVANEIMYFFFLKLLKLENISNSI